MKKITLLLVGLMSFAVSADPIEDNSLLIEEAYNQEPGIVQFMLRYEGFKNKDWTFQFDNEIPIGGQTHQFSYSVPYGHVDAQDKSGIRDMTVSYRYQLMNNDTVAMAPRFSIVLPTGDDSKGLGEGGTGFEFNMAASFKLSPRFVMHMNAGASFVPRSKVANPPAKVSSLETSYGMSGIYHISDVFDVMLETKGEGENLYLAPGVRTAINSGEWQIVPGLAYAQNIKPYADEDYSIIAYFSVGGPI